MSSRPSDDVAAGAAAPGAAELWTLRLYVAGQSLRSLRAVAKLQRLCAEDLDVRYRLEVIDLHQQPELRQYDQVLALPAHIKRLPEPLRSIVGDMSNTERVLVGLDLLPRLPLGLNAHLLARHDPPATTANSCTAAAAGHRWQCRHNPRAESCANCTGAGRHSGRRG